MAWTKDGNIKGSDGVAADAVVHVDTTGATVTNTTTQGNLASFTVPAGTLGTNKSLRVHLIGTLLNNSGITATLQLGISFGGTTLWADTSAAQTANAANHPLDIEFTLCGAGTTSSQLLSGTVQMGRPGSATTGLGDIATVVANATGFASPIQGTGAKDSTADQTLIIFAKFAAANAALTVTSSYVLAKVDGYGAKGDTGAAGAAVWTQITQAAYDALSPPDSGTLYVIVG